MMIAAGCSGGKSSSDGNNKETASKNEAFPVTIKDAVGHSVKLDKKPTKIVSLIPSNTEIAFALGLDKEIVGVTDNDTYPKEALKKPKVGGMKFNVEKIIGMKPDVVLAHASAAHNSADGLKQLEDAGVKVIVINDAKSFDDTYKTIDMIAKATGTEKKGQEIVDDMKKKLASIEEQAKQVKKEKKVWVEISPSPEIYTAGQGTFIDDMLKSIHAKNAAGALKGWPKVSEEQPVKYNPDAIITTYGSSDQDVWKQISGRKAWSNVQAVKAKDIHNLNNDLLSRPGPRLAQGVEELAKAIYPDVFKK
nr:ABC transporter substrate-binding protein [Fictibacillus macauensis]